MVQTYKDTPSYHQYLNIDPVTGRGERLDHLMPHLQYNEDGQPIIVPGELFCRWRSDDGALCVKGTALSSTTALRKHYHGCHGSPIENRRHGSNTVGFQGELHRWYRAIVNGEMPRWVPRKAADATVAIMPDITSLIIFQENDDEEKAKEGVNEEGNTASDSMQTKKIYKTRMELKKRMERKVMMLKGKLKFKEEMKLKKIRLKKMMKLEKEMKFERMKLRKMRLKKEMRLKEKMKSRR